MTSNIKQAHNNNIYNISNKIKSIKEPLINIYWSQPIIMWSVISNNKQGHNINNNNSNISFQKCQLNFIGHN